MLRERATLKLEGSKVQWHIHQHTVHYSTYTHTRAGRYIQYVQYIRILYISEFFVAHFNNLFMHLKQVAFTCRRLTLPLKLVNQPTVVLTELFTSKWRKIVKHTHRQTHTGYNSTSCLYRECKGHIQSMTFRWLIICSSGATLLVFPAWFWIKCFKCEFKNITITLASCWNSTD